MNLAMAIAIWTAHIVSVPRGWVTLFVDEKYLVEDQSLFPEPLRRPFKWSHGIMPTWEFAVKTTEKFKVPVEFPMMGPYNISTLTVYNIDGQLYGNSHLAPTNVIHDFPYDLYLHAGMMEFLARQVDLPLGPLSVQVPLLYLRQTEVESARRLLRTRWPFRVMDMPRLLPDELARYQTLVTKYLDSPRFELLVRDPVWKTPGGNYLRDLATVLRLHVCRDDTTKVLYGHRLLGDATLKHVVRQWLADTEILHVATPAMILDTPFEKVDE